MIHAVTINACSEQKLDAGLCAHMHTRTCAWGHNNYNHGFSISSDVNKDCCTNCQPSSADTLCHIVTNLTISTDCTDDTYCEYPLFFHLLPTVL